MSETERMYRIEDISKYLLVRSEKQEYPIFLKNIRYECLIKIQENNCWNYFFLLSAGGSAPKVLAYFELKTEEKGEIDVLFTDVGRFDLEGIVEISEKIIIKTKRITFGNAHALIAPYSYESRNMGVVVPNNE